MHFKKTILISIAAAFFMFSFSFALSPLYRALCNKTGLSGAIPIGTLPDTSRTIEIQFVTTQQIGNNWEFYPTVKTIHVHPEQMTQVIFIAKNKMQKTRTVQAIPSFAPTFSAKYFHKTQCFCFNQQTLKPGELLQMPVVFYIDQELPTGVNTITLAYTLYDVTKK